MTDTGNGRNASIAENQDIHAWQQQLIRGVLLALVIVGPLAVIAGSYYAYETNTMWFIPSYLVTYGLLAAVAFWRRGPYLVRVGVFLAFVYIIGFLDFFQDGRGGSGRVFLLGLVGMASLFLNRRGRVLVSFLVLITMIFLTIAFSSGWVSIPPENEVSSTDLAGWVTNTAVLLLIMVLLQAGIGYVVPSMTAALKQSQRMAHDLEAQRADLERAVAERTEVLSRRARYLEATSEVARSVSSILEIDELLTTAVRLISERMGFYHAGLFFVDPAGEWAVLQAASSEGGQRMLARGHRLRVGAQGIVGDVAARGEPRIALDVGQDAVFFNNPDLPETHSEIALPLRSRGEVIGVLDVQTTEREAFTQEDISVLQTLADQVALAISNARLFYEAQESLAAQQRAYGELTGEAWRTLLSEQGGLGFVKQKGLVLPAEGAWSQEAAQAAKTGQLMQGDRTEDTRAATLAVPIKSGDRVIAVLDAQLPAGNTAWTPDQVALLQSLSEQVSQAMERARLYQDTQRRAARERLTREITDAVQRATDIESLMRIATEELVRVLGGAQGYMRLGIESLKPDSAHREEELEDAED
ncbi:MAG: GAF domain-containing protein [Anaerolineae bacterium]|nr:GAF domain-containing protein [Anaerolineae bacterium]